MDAEIIERPAKMKLPVLEVKNKTTKFTIRPTMKK